MFYKVLFLLTLFNLIKSGKSFIRENVITVDGKVLEIPMGKYISLGMTMLFYIKSKSRRKRSHKLNNPFK